MVEHRNKFTPVGNEENVNARVMRVNISGYTKTTLSLKMRLYDPLGHCTELKQ